MNITSILALLAGSLLVSGFLATAFGQYVPGGKRGIITQLTLDPLPECVNVVQCNATFLVGANVTFTGMLTDLNDEPIPDAEVVVYHLDLDLHPLASGTTGPDGSFEMSWITEFIADRKGGRTLHQQISEVFTVVARFEGDDTYASSSSGKMILTVQVRDMLTFVIPNQNLFKVNETAIIFVNFVSTGVTEFTDFSFVDPDTIRATYDNEEIELERKKTGSYTFVTPLLTAGHHQVVVDAAKQDYNGRVGFVTVQVMGFFGK